MDEKLIGSWKIDMDDQDAVEQMGEVTMVFDTENVLRYITREKKSIFITSMTYRVEGDVIVSILPPGIQEERNKYSFPDDQTLLLESEGQKTRFFRMEV